LSSRSIKTIKVLMMDDVIGGETRHILNEQQHCRLQEGSQHEAVVNIVAALRAFSQSSPTSNPN
jgi:hypothetical protein